MVLQDIGDSPPPDDFGEDQFSTPNFPSGCRFDESQMPLPFPIISPFIGYSAPAMRLNTEATFQFAEREIHRSLTPVEAQALAFHLYEMEQRKSYFAVTGLAAGIFRAYNTMAINRYPFYKPKPEDINPNKFLFVKGPYAQIARHMWRFSLYGVVAIQLGKLVGQVITRPQAGQAAASDPLLRDFTNDLRSSRMGTPQSRRGMIAAPREEHGNLATDDMSPTAGNDGWSHSDGDSLGDSNHSAGAPQDDSQFQTSRQSRRREPTNAWKRQSSRSVDQDSASSESEFLRDDGQSESKSGESAWERLRQERERQGKDSNDDQKRW